MSHDKTIRIDGNRLFSMPLVVAVALAGALIGATLAWARVLNQQEAQRQALEETAGTVKVNGQRISRMELTTAADIAEIKADVRWIKETIREQPSPSPSRAASPESPTR